MADSGGEASLHIWLPMPTEAARRISHAALRAGVEFTPVDAPMAAPTDQSGLRICVGARSDPDDFLSALRILGEVVRSPAEALTVL